MEVSHLIVAFIGFSLGVFIESIFSKLDEEPETEICKHCLVKNPDNKSSHIAKDRSIQDTCIHPEHAIKMRVVETCVTCETVEHYCSGCGKVICSITDCI